MNRDRKINKKVLKKFLNLIDKGVDVNTYLSKFPDEYDELKEYADIIKDFEDLKKTPINKDFEEQSLKNIYLKAKLENSENRKDSEKTSKKDLLFIRLRPAYLKPLIIFFSVFIFMSFSFGGILYASEDSIPGDTLYTVKRASENLQLALTPYKYEKTIYLKMLDSRLNEAHIILSQVNFKDNVAVENLIKEIDDTYERCRNRNYLGSYEDEQLQNKIKIVKEQYRKRYKMRENNIDNLPDETKGNKQDATTSSNVTIQDLGQNELGYAENKNSSSQDGQNHDSKQNQYGR